MSPSEYVKWLVDRDLEERPKTYTQSLEDRVRLLEERLQVAEPKALFPSKPPPEITAPRLKKARKSS